MFSKIGGKKYDGDKPRMSLLIDGCARALLAVGDVLTFGAKKYADHDWINVENGIERYTSALIRHMAAKGAGQEFDPESGLSHSAHVACNAVFILELELRKKESIEKFDQESKEAATEDGQPDFVKAMYQALNMDRPTYIYRSTR